MLAGSATLSRIQAPSHREAGPGKKCKNILTARVGGRRRGGRSLRCSSGALYVAIARGSANIAYILLNVYFNVIQGSTFDITYLVNLFRF